MIRADADLRRAPGSSLGEAQGSIFNNGGLVMSNIRRGRLQALAAVAPLALLGATGGAHAQAAAALAVQPGTAIQDVIVTGEKREVSIQRAALAITAISDQSLKQAGIKQLSDLNAYVPGLTVAKNGGYTRVMTIRGVGFETSDNISSQPGTSFHIDGIYLAGAYSLAMDLLDLERVEILRGPQGTVFGQSATGGVINAITVRPKLGVLTGEGELSLGDYNLVKATGAVNIPVSDNVAIRAVVQRYQHTGFAVQSDLPDYRLDDADHLSERLSVLWKPTEALTFTVGGQHFRAHEHGAAQKNIDDPNPDPRRLSQDFPNKYDMEFYLGFGIAELQMPWAKLKSTTSYQWMKNPNQVDNDRLDLKSLGFYDNLKNWENDVQAVSQEFNLSSNPGSAVDWIVGAYFLWEQKTWHIVEFVGTDANPTFNLPPNLPANWPYNLDYTLDTTLNHYSYAGFGQATVHLGDRLRVTAGGRYAREVMNNFTDTDHGLYGPALHQYPRFTALTGKAEADFDITPSNMAYASVARGYKPGGVNYNSFPYFVPLIYEPESVISYEVGMKNRLFDRRGVLNLAAFYYTYQNFQYQEEDPIPYQGGVSNIPKAHIWGAEAELSLSLTDNLRLGANGTFLGGEFVGDYLALDPSRAHEATLAAAALGYGPFDAYTIGLRAQQVRNTNGNTPPKMPGFEGGVNLTYTRPLADGAVLTARADYIYRGKYNYRIFNDSVRDVVPSYDIVNLYVEYSPPGDHWAFSLAASNLFDTAGVNSRYSNPFGRFTTSQEFIAPRQVIGTIRYRY